MDRVYTFLACLAIVGVLSASYVGYMLGYYTCEEENTQVIKHEVICDTVYLPWPSPYEYRDTVIDLLNKDRNRLHDHWKSAQIETR